MHVALGKTWFPSLKGLLVFNRLSMASTLRRTSVRRRHTDKVDGVIAASPALPPCDRRIRAKGSRPIRHAVADVRRDYSIGRLSLCDPSNQCANCVEGIGTGAT